MQDWQTFVFPQGDGVEAYYERCGQFIHDILFEYENNRILIIAHKGFILACWSACLPAILRMCLSRSIENGEAVTVTV